MTAVTTAPMLQLPPIYKSSSSKTPQTDQQQRIFGRKVTEASLNKTENSVWAGVIGSAAYIGASIAAVAFPPLAPVIAVGMIAYSFYQYMGCKSKIEELESQLDYATGENKAIIQQMIGSAEAEKKTAFWGMVLSCIPAGGTCAKGVIAMTKGAEATIGKTIMKQAFLYNNGETALKATASVLTTAGETVAAGGCMMNSIKVGNYRRGKTQELIEKRHGGIMTAEDDQVTAEITKATTEVQGSVAAHTARTEQEVALERIPYWQRQQLLNGPSYYNPLSPLGGGLNTYGGMYGMYNGYSNIFGNQYSAPTIPSYNWSTTAAV